ncbi:plus-3-domain-containing protein [Phellopilus nigrolimitatus]|nr:plus-3-domain-containing protein [Phellopilus nigrolimitatus]
MDRIKLMQLPEIERENILAQRLEEMQLIQDKRNLDQMLRAQREDNVSKAAKRAHQVRGATKEKTRKLDGLKAKRKAKSEKKRTRINSPKRERSSSPMDMEMSSEDEEDGQISKLEQQEERESRLLNKAKPEDEDLTLEDLEKCRLSRNKLVFIKGSWVCYLIGADQGQLVYRICEIANLGANPAKPYKIENEYFDTSLELRHGAAIKVFPMDKDSNAAFTEDEWRRLKATSEHEKVKLPAKRTIKKKLQQFAKLTSHSLTEADVAAILARKAEVNRSLPKSRTTATKAALECAELVRMRALAQMRRDFAESAALEANRDAVRRAEVAEAEHRKKARMARAAAANGSRAGTPGVFKDSPNGTPLLGASLALGDGARSVSPAPPQKGVLGKRAFESIVASSVEVDLVDFWALLSAGERGRGSQALPFLFCCGPGGAHV